MSSNSQTTGGDAIDVAIAQGIDFDGTAIDPKNLIFMVVSWLSKLIVNAVVSPIRCDRALFALARSIFLKMNSIKNCWKLALPHLKIKILPSFTTNKDSLKNLKPRMFTARCASGKHSGF